MWGFPNSPLTFWGWWSYFLYSVLYSRSPLIKLFNFFYIIESLKASSWYYFSGSPEKFLFEEYPSNNKLWRGKFVIICAPDLNLITVCFIGMTYIGTSIASQRFSCRSSTMQRCSTIYLPTGGCGVFLLEKEALVVVVVVFNNAKGQVSVVKFCIFNPVLIDFLTSCFPIYDKIWEMSSHVRSDHFTTLSKGKSSKRQPKIRLVEA